MKQELLAHAAQLGFALCRVTRCTAPPHAAEFHAWLDAGHAGDMAWLERNKERRTDPQLVLPGAQSIVVLGMNYWQGEGAEREAPSPFDSAALRSAQAVERPASSNSSSISPSSSASPAWPRREKGEDEEMDEEPSAPAFHAPHPPPHEPRGRIARYAWGEDYHDLIERKLRSLDEWLRERGGAQRCYVDTGPVLERDFAALAGAGWHGKSTMLISPELGAWFFLAEVLTTLPIEPDAPLPDRCGKCTRCIAACPTGAIVAPHQVDARRCISYLTIELKGSIPEEMRPLIGDRIYGCDDCAAACPWNRFAQASTEAAFAAREYVHGWPLRDFLALHDDAFRALFRKSPIKRIKRRGFLRNVCVALGNVGTPDDLPALEHAAQDPESLIAEHAQWAIGRINARSVAAAAASSGTGLSPFTAQASTGSLRAC